MTIGERIELLRKALGLTQAKLGAKLNLSDKAVSKWEKNNGMPDIQSLKKLSSCLKISLDFLTQGHRVREDDYHAAALIADYEKKQKEAKLLKEEEQRQKNKTEGLKNKIERILAVHRRVLTEFGLEINDENMPEVNFEASEREDEIRINGEREGVCRLEYGEHDECVILDCDKLLSFGRVEVYEKIKNLMFKWKARFEKKIEHCKERKNQFCYANKSGYTCGWDDDCPPERCGGCREVREYSDSFVGCWERGLSNALENLSENNPKYFECVVWLIENGGCFYKGQTKDKSKTNFFYLVAKKMCKI
jgi:transcriptional regulator with XRE-family HTH domain